MTILTELFKEEQKVVVALGGACGVMFWELRQRVVAEDGTDRLCRNVCNELPLGCVMSQKSADLGGEGDKQKLVQNLAIDEGL